MNYIELLKLLKENNLTNDNYNTANVGLGSTTLRTIKKPLQHIEKYGKTWNIEFRVSKSNTEVEVKYDLPNCQDVYLCWDIR